MITIYLKEALKAGAEYFNESRRKKAEGILKEPGFHLENLKNINGTLAGLDFSIVEGKDLSNINFMHLNLSECMLKGFNLNKSKFIGSNIKGTRFVGCDLTECDFSKSDLSGVILRNCKTGRARFKGAIVSDQVKSQISHAQFKETNNKK